MNCVPSPRCECCGGQEWKLHRYSASITYLACRRCHYAIQVRADVRNKASWFEAEQLKFYDESSLVLAPDFTTLNAEITRRRITFIRRLLPPGASLVEVGPGAGDLIAALSQAGYAATAIEHSIVLAERLRERGIRVIVGDFVRQSLPKASFDAYCSFHVIEHVVDFRHHLATAADCVKPGGYAFIATPNARGWEHRLPFNLSPNYDSSHFQLFAAESLRRALSDSGWEILDVATPSYAIAWLRVITRVLRRARGQDVESTGGQYARSSSKRLRKAIAAFAFLTWPLRRLQEALGGGNELLVIARRTSAASPRT
jgi:SAM-dependent methyltransferase